MKISEIRVYQVDLPLVEGRYSWSEGKYVEVFDSTVVELRTDAGLSGYGEVCPLGPFYLPAFGLGARAGIAELSATLIGEVKGFREIKKVGQLALQVYALVVAGVSVEHPTVRKAFEVLAMAPLHHTYTTCCGRGPWRSRCCGWTVHRRRGRPADRDP